jgi:hypothetical protein
MEDPSKVGPKIHIKYAKFDNKPIEWRLPHYEGKIWEEAMHGRAPIREDTGGFLQTIKEFFAGRLRK